MASYEIPVDLEKALFEAGERARAKAGFLRHAAVFCGSGLFFLAVDAGASPESLWFMWPLAAWSPVLAVHAALAWRPGRNGPAKKEDVS